MTGSPGSDEERTLKEEAQAVRKIELRWPDKGRLPIHREDGGWQLLDPPEARVQLPFIPVGRFSEGTSAQRESLVIEGERLGVLSTLRRTTARGVKLAYLDLPRIVIDDKTRAFQGEPNRTWSTYLNVVREHVKAVMPLLARDGVIVAQSGDAEEPYVRIVLTELLGLENYVGTAVWQRSYAPRNPKNMKEFTATHDPIIVFATEREMLSRVALDRVPQGYGNPDGDPRGPWRVVRQKGAATRRERTDLASIGRPIVGAWQKVNFLPGSGASRQ